MYFLKKSLNMESIPVSSLDCLTGFERKIFSLFVQKKFKRTEQELISGENFCFDMRKKTKRNEEILKFALKGYFKYICSSNGKKYAKNFFQLKKELSLKIFKEISDALNCSLEEFMGQSFVDCKKLIIKGNKRILLYNKSITF